MSVHCDRRGAGRAHDWSEQARTCLGADAIAVAPAVVRTGSCASR